MSEPKQHDLHGVENTPFEDWVNDEVTYLERVTTTTREQAIGRLCNEFGVGEDEVDPQPIFMRWVTKESEPERFEGMVHEDAGWLICDPDHPAAVPFWKDAP